MRISVFSLSLFFATLAVAAQDMSRTVFWSGDRSCGRRSPDIKASDKFTCKSIPTDRGPVSVVSFNGISLSVAILDDGKFYIVAAGIRNNSGKAIQFDSDLWGAAHFKSKEDFDSGLAPKLAETSVPSRDIVRSISSEMNLKNSLGDLMGDLQMTGQTKILRGEDGTRYKTTVIVPDTEAQIAEQRQVNARNELFKKEQREIRKTALTAKSVWPSKSITGRVYFRTVDDTDYVVFSLSVAGTSLIFQLLRGGN